MRSAFRSASSSSAAYRDLHARIGKTGRQYLPSPESLFKQIFRRGGCRAIEPLVDACSLVALRTRVSIGAHDLARLSLPVRLARTVGDESLLPIGESAPLPLGAGEHAYRDAGGQMLGRMEIRQAAPICIGPATRDVLFIVQGHRALGAEVLRATAAELLGTLQRLVGPYANRRITSIE